jgi:phosphoribosylanthranilate isomerase
VKLKICGITRAEDALAAARLGAWAVGFIFYPKSPRYIEPQRARAIVDQLPAGLEKVGVFVNPGPGEAERAARQAGLTRVQLHGTESPEECAAVGLPIIKAFSEGSDSDLARYSRVASIFLIDSRAPDGVWGGTGKRAEEESVVKFMKRRKLEAPRSEVFLAGEIDETNVTAAIRAFSPDGIDVSSGVEDSPGIKNETKMRALFARLKEAQS